MSLQDSDLRALLRERARKSTLAEFLLSLEVQDYFAATVAESIVDFWIAANHSEAWQRLASDLDTKKGQKG